MNPYSIQSWEKDMYSKRSINNKSLAIGISVLFKEQGRSWGESQLVQYLHSSLKFWVLSPAAHKLGLVVHCVFPQWR